MSTELFLVVLTSSVCHAAWNVAARRAAGDFALFWLAQCASVVTLCLLTAFVVWSNPSIWPPSSEALGYGAITGILHGVYYRLLTAAYERGEISLVYPIARGTGIGLTALLAWFVLNEQISTVGTAGIGLVLLGSWYWEPRLCCDKQYPVGGSCWRSGSEYPSLRTRWLTRSAPISSTRSFSCG